MTRSLIRTDYLQNEVVGFSVTNDLMRQGFYGRISDPTRWRHRWYSGGSVDLYADRNNPGPWSSNNNSLNPTTTGGLIDSSGTQLDASSQTLRNQVDRIIFNVSGMCFQAADPTTPGYNGGTRPDLGLTSHDTTGYSPGGYVVTVADWIAYINATVSNIRFYYPNVKMILLQPNIGGASGVSLATQTSNPANPGYDDSGAAGGVPWSQGFGIVRAHHNNPYINLAIIRCLSANVRPGWFARNTNNANVTDWAGHLTTAEYISLGQSMADFYETYV